MKRMPVAKVFPAYMQNEGGDNETLFETKMECGQKIHTLRLNAKGYYQDGDMVQRYQWEGMPYQSKQVNILDPVWIGVQPISLWFDGDLCVPSLDVDGETLARNDGLLFSDFVQWFCQGDRFPKTPVRWDGYVIHFTDIRYAERKSFAEMVVGS